MGLGLRRRRRAYFVVWSGSGTAVLIIGARPYSDPHNLVSKGILSEDRYARIGDRVTAK